jgi:acyl carrier protein
MGPESKIRDMICDILTCEADDLTVDSFLSDDLGMTPDDLEELVAVLQEEFEIEIPDIDAEDWETVGDLIGYVQEKIENE